MRLTPAPIFLSLILLVSIFFRFYHLADYTEFLGDQGRDVVIVRDFLKNGNLFFIGPQTSIGNMYLGPFYYYLIVAPGLLLFRFNPIGPAFFVALLGVVTTFLIYWVSQKWFSSQVGLIASFLYAISPVAIKYTTFSWNPNVLPLFSLLFIYFMSRGRMILASLAFIMAINSHFLAICLLFPAAVIWLVRYGRIDIKPDFIRVTIIAVLIFLISLTPQILFDLKHHGQNVGAFITFFSQRETTVNLKIYKSIPLLPQLFRQVNTRLVAGKNETIGTVLSLVLFGLLVRSLYLQFKTKTFNRFFILCLLWLFFGLISLGLYKQHIYDHYFGFLYPVIFIITAHLIVDGGKIAGGFLLVSIILVSALHNPLLTPPPRQLRRTQQIDRSVLDAAGGSEFNFALLAKQNYDPGYLYFFYEWNTPIRSLSQKLTSQLFVVCEPDGIDCNPINHPKTEIANFGWAKIDDTWQIDSFKIFKLSHLIDEKSLSR